jgi:hypothetical protein
VILVKLNKKSKKKRVMLDNERSQKLKYLLSGQVSFLEPEKHRD